MNVLVRNKQGEKGIRLRRQSPRGDDTPLTAEPEGTALDPHEHRAAVTPVDVPAGRRRLVGPVEDNALYSCSCGFVFEAQVSTSVGCPHCGSGQAW